MLNLTATHYTVWKMKYADRRTRMTSRRSFYDLPEKNAWNYYERNIAPSLRTALNLCVLHEDEMQVHAEIWIVITFRPYAAVHIAFGYVLL
jgi:hypothetical protein